VGRGNDGEGDWTAGGGSINAGHPVQWGGETTGKGIGRPVVAASMPAVRFGGEGKRRGDWGVKRVKIVVPFLGEEWSSGWRQRTQEVPAAVPGRDSGGRRRLAD
jgi:hypothetical protein